MQEFPKSSWIDPRLQGRASSIHGNGIFTSTPLEAGETIMIWGGELFTLEQIGSGLALPRSYFAVREDLFLGHTSEHGNTLDDDINHSCDPTVWMADEVTIVTRRALEAGEEVTIDYAMYLDADWEPRKCLCGSSLCRGMITSEDWRRPELFARYGYHFQPFINERIRRLRAQS